MDNVICYLNTDLDLVSKVDLKPLARFLKSRGLYSLHTTKGEDGIWYATFEADALVREPEEDITKMLGAIDSLTAPLRKVWKGCQKRVFDIGYDCGKEPWAFTQGISKDVLKAMAKVGASLKITLYPHHPPKRVRRTKS